MKIDFSKIQLKDIDGAVLVDKETNEPVQLHKTIANAIYRITGVLDLVDIAREINRGKEVDLRKNEVSEIKRLVSSEKGGFLAFAKKAILDYMETTQNTVK